MQYTFLYNNTSNTIIQTFYGTYNKKNTIFFKKLFKK